MKKEKKKKETVYTSFCVQKSANLGRPQGRQKTNVKLWAGQFTWPQVFCFFFLRVFFSPSPLRLRIPPEFVQETRFFNISYFPLFLFVPTHLFLYSKKCIEPGLWQVCRLTSSTLRTKWVISTCVQESKQLPLPYQLGEQRPLRSD